jgi:hypothetical protein
MRNLLTRVPRAAQPAVATLVRSIFAQPDATSVREQHERLLEQLSQRFPAAAELLEEAGPDILAFTAVPKEVWRQVWSNNPLERLNREIRRRTDVVGIFPNRAAALRLVGAVLAEQNDEWADSGRRYMSLEAIAKTLAPPSPEATMEVAMIAAWRVTKRGWPCGHLRTPLDGTRPIPAYRLSNDVVDDDIANVSAIGVEIQTDERATRERWAHRRTSAQVLALRGRIVLSCAAGKTNQEVAAEVGVHQTTLGKWRARSVAHRLDGLHDEPGPARRAWSATTTWSAWS